VKAAWRAWWLPGAALATLWLPLLGLWRQAWLAQPELAFGWGVPVLAIYIAWERSLGRPAAQALGPRGRALAWFGAALGLLLLLAALPVLEANALWPTAQWAGAVAAGLVTVAGLALAGGLPWVGDFAFPVVFLSTALTWPTLLHVWIITDLAGANARIAAEFVSVAGYPAIVNGNVIAVASGFVGIAEACSGLRSLQAVWMEAWFLGEFFRLNWPRRLGLVAVSLGVATASNLSRTIFLTWEAAAHGLAASDRWHDAAGVVELVVTLSLVAVAALWIGRKKLRGQVEKVFLARPGNIFNLTPSVCGWAWLTLAGALLAEAGTQAWYFAHEGEARTLVHWTLHAPGPDWETVPLPPRVAEVLQYSEAEGLTSRDPLTGSSVLAFLVSWRGDAANGESPEWHDPSICLPGSGAKLAAVLGEFTIPIEGVSVPFVGYRFIIAGRPFQVFFCHWDAELGRARGDAETAGSDVRARRLQRVREGRRRNDVAHLTLELQEASDGAAIAWLRAWAPRLLQPHFSTAGLSL
jgi:exosortase/archaeosortase family protein